MDKGLTVPLVGTFIFIILIISVSTENKEIRLEITKHIELTKVVEVDKKKFFSILSSPQQYPKVLPDDIKSVKIINQTESVIIAEETISRLGLTSTMIVKHEIHPFEKHVIQVIEGDAKDTKIVIEFFESGQKTTIKSNIDLKVSGPASFPIHFMNQQKFESAYTTVIDAFALYSKKI